MDTDREDIPRVEEDPDRPVISESDVDMLHRVCRLLEEAL